MPRRDTVLDQSPDERQRFVNVLDHLRRDNRLKFEVAWHLFYAADKDFRARRSRDRHGFGGKVGSKTAIKEWPGFIEEKTMTAADLQKVAAGKATLLEI